MISQYFTIHEHETLNGVFVIKANGLKPFHVARSFIIQNKDNENAFLAICQNRLHSTHDFKESS